MSLLGGFEIIQMGESKLLYCMYIYLVDILPIISHANLKLNLYQQFLSVTDTGILINIGRIA